MTRAIAAIIAAATLTACTEMPERIEAQKDRCTQVGHTPGTLDHAKCTERSMMHQEQMQQNAALATVLFY